tara:strand:- start:14140 stop:14298 length:159 start_codon:yes stop_codon:yes gene_type:complete
MIGTSFEQRIAVIEQRCQVRDAEDRQAIAVAGVTFAALICFLGMYGLSIALM